MTDMTKARSRTQDPQTSHDAAEWMEEDGKCDGMRAIVFGMIQQHPKHTAGEIAAVEGVPREKIAKRFRELERLGAIRAGVARPCKISGRPCLTWYAVKGGGV